MLAIWSLVPLPFLNPTWTSRPSWFTYCWSLTWRILSITCASMWDECIVLSFEHSVSLPSFGIGKKTDLFQSCGHCWVFQICWHIECSAFTASSFRIWNTSTGIPSPPLALFEVMLHDNLSAVATWYSSLLFYWNLCLWGNPVSCLLMWWKDQCIYCILFAYINRDLFFLDWWGGWGVGHVSTQPSLQECRNAHLPCTPLPLCVRHGAGRSSVSFLVLTTILQVSYHYS